jgi:hypothetical protein
VRLPQYPDERVAAAVGEVDAAAEADATDRVGDAVALCEKGEFVDDADSQADGVVAHETGAPWMSTHCCAAAATLMRRKRPL